MKRAPTIRILGIEVQESIHQDLMAIFAFSLLRWHKRTLARDKSRSRLEAVHNVSPIVALTLIARGWESNLRRIGVCKFVGRAVVVSLFVAGSMGASAFARPILWNTGPNDGVSALNSQASDSFQAVAADDFRLLNPGETGADFTVTQLRGWMTTFGTPDLLGRSATVYADDGSGLPGAVIATFPGVVISTSPSIGFPGFSDEVIVADGLTLTLQANSRYWISWRGSGAGLYYFNTGGNGAVQGEEGVFQSASYGIPDFTPVSMLPPPNNLPATDFAFLVIGDQDPIADGCFVWSPGPWDNISSVSSLFTPLSLQRTTAADDVLLPTGNGRPYSLESITVWMATNTNPAQARLTIYEDDSGAPGAPLVIYTAPTASFISDYAGGPPGPSLALYELTFDSAALQLAPGTRYWVSAQGGGTGAIQERARLVTAGAGELLGLEAHANNPLLGFSDWTPVSNAGLLGFASDLAIKVEGFQHSKPGDANGDDSVTFGDITQTIAAFGANYLPCSGPGDANNDGVVDFGDITEELANWGL